MGSMGLVRLLGAGWRTGGMGGVSCVLAAQRAKAGLTSRDAEEMWNRSLTLWEKVV